MKVTFVYADIVQGGSWSGSYSTGVASLAAILRAAGHAVSLVHVKSRPRPEDLAARIESHAPDLVGFSTTSTLFPEVALWAGALRARSDVPTISGGVHATLDPQDTIGAGGIDMVCLGEGEDTLVEACSMLAAGRSPAGIAGLWVKSQGGIVRGRARPPVADLNRLPFPDRSIYEYEKLNLVNQGRGIVMASRGCPYECTYCCNHALKRQAAGKEVPYVRFRSVDSVIGETRKLLSDYPFLGSIHFEDDIFPLKPDWFGEFLARFRREIGLPFTLNMIPSLMSDEVAGSLKESGCALIQMGIESGNDSIRKQVLKRPIERRQLVEAFGLCRAHGIRTLAFNMVGIPLETPEAILDTIKLNAEVRPDLCQTSIAYPFPMTRMREICEERGLLTDRRVGDYFSRSALALPDLSNDRVTFYRVYFKVLVRLYASLAGLPRPVRERGVAVLDRILGTPRNLDPLYRSLNWAYRGLEDLAKRSRNRLRFRRIRHRRRGTGAWPVTPLGTCPPGRGR